MTGRRQRRVPIRTALPVHDVRWQGGVLERSSASEEYLVRRERSRDMSTGQASGRERPRRLIVGQDTGSTSREASTGMATGKKSGQTLEPARNRSAEHGTQE